MSISKLIIDIKELYKVTIYSKSCEKCKDKNLKLYSSIIKKLEDLNKK